MLSMRRSVRWASDFGKFRVPTPINEPMLDFAPGSAERQQLRRAIDRIMQQQTPKEIPCIIDGKPVPTGNISTQLMPSSHQKVLSRVHNMTSDVVVAAIKSSLNAKVEWQAMPFEHRASIFLKAADLLCSPKYRYRMMAATMLGQSKNVWQAEIDCIAEMADFWRFNVKYAEAMYENQPLVAQSKGIWNRLEYRPLEGFIVAIAPFNFSAIAANLPSAPALLGNTVLFKPSTDAIRSSHLVCEILTEAGLPDGVINFVPGDGKVLGDIAFAHPDFAGVHFTGSTRVFNSIWNSIGKNITKFKSYPRIVGETGGKNFHFVHESACLDTVVNQTIRGAFEYQGQKCSATSRAYIPDNKWDDIKSSIIEQMETLQMGCVTNFENFVSAVINKTAFDRCKSYIERAKESPACEIIYGGTCDDSVGYFVEPTIIVTTDPHYETLKEEIFGPILTIFVYDPANFESTLQLCDQTAPYALTGGIFGRDRYALDVAADALVNTAGNIYINDKSTGAIVGQQPFGGSRRSGTNDKSGSAINLSCWVSPRTIKETFLPLQSFRYPHMEREK